MKKFLLIAIILTLFSLESFSVVILDPSLVTQSRYRWRNDNGTQTSATWKAAENTAITVTSIDENIRLRLQFTNTSTATSGSLSQNLEYSKDGGTTWTTITNSDANDFKFSNSTNVSHAAATTEQITTSASGTFRAGSIISNTTPDLTSTLGTSAKTENEFVIKPTLNLEPLKTYLFRISPQDSYTTSNYAALNTNCVVNIKTVTPGELCLPGNVTLSATASPGATIRWYNVATGGTPLATGSTFTTPVISTTTTYYVEAMLSTCISQRVPVVANINPFILTTTNDTICHEGILTLTAIPTPHADVEWYADAAMTTLLGTGTTFTTPIISTSKTYYAIAKSASCSSAVYPVIAHILPRPEVTVTPEIDTVCNGSYATFTSEDVSNYTYVWSDGTTGPIMTTNIPGFHYLEVNNEAGCTNEYSVYLDTFLDIKVDGFDYIPMIFTSPKTYSFTPINPVAVTNYHWDFGDGNTSSLLNPTHEYADYGNYTITLKVYNDCDSTSISMNINVQADNTSILDTEMDKHLQIYPNPATTHIQIHNPMGIALKELIILNSNGQIISKLPMQQYMQHQFIDVSSLPRGISYILFISKENKMSVKKVSLL